MLRQTPKQGYNDFYVGICADIHDPQMIGRIKVFCPLLFGDKKSDWAIPCFPPNQFGLPQERQMVWFKVLNNNPDELMWFGVIYNMAAGTVPSPFQEVHAELKDKYTGASIDRDKADHVNDLDSILHKPYHLHPQFYDPHKFGWLYPSGTKIEIQEANTGKYIDIGLSGDDKAIDRNIKVTDVTGEEGIILQDYKDQYIKLFDDKKDDTNWSIEIRDKNDGKLRFNPKSGEEYIRLFDKKGDEVKVNSIDGQEWVQIKDKYGNYVRVDATSGAEKITAEDGYGQKMILDPVAKTVTLQNKAGTGKLVIDDAGNIVITALSLTVTSNDIKLGKDGVYGHVAREGDPITITDPVTHEGVIGTATTTILQSK